MAGKRGLMKSGLNNAVKTFADLALLRNKNGELGARRDQACPPVGPGAAASACEGLGGIVLRLA
ncbi:MAG: hypothetical protein AAGJ70_12225 [Pseudomonadota bacterium]